MSDIWQNPGVKEALIDGRDADDILVLDCRKCGKAGYWNEGRHFSCSYCGTCYGVTSEMASDAVTLADAAEPWPPY
jgi:hypothetical protein